MVKIKLRRTGARKQPSYRLVVADARSPRKGTFIEIIGNFNPRTEPETLVVNQERAKYWLGKGAQPTDTVARLLTKSGILEKSDTKPKISDTKPEKSNTTNKETT